MWIPGFHLWVRMSGGQTREVACLISSPDDLGACQYLRLLPSIVGKESACQWRRHGRCGFDPWVGKIPWSRKWQPTPVFLPRKSHGQTNLVGYRPWSLKESDMTEWLTLSLFTFKDRTGVGGQLSFWGWKRMFNNRKWETARSQEELRMPLNGGIEEQREKRDGAGGESRG